MNKNNTRNINKNENTNDKTDILLITNKIFQPLDNAEEIILEVIPEAEVNILHYKEITEEIIKKTNIIFGWPRYRHLKIAENLEWLHLPSAGVENYTDKSLYNNGQIILSNSSGVYGKPIAEHVLALILSFNRNIPYYVEKKMEKKWEKRYKPRDFFNSKLAVIGLGDIGSEIAVRAKAMGAEVMAVKKHITEVPDYVDHLYTTEEMDKVFKKADYIVLALPLTEETKEIISTEEFKMMKESAYLVNIGRGELIDQSALIKALKDEWIAGAGLDVTVPEPLPEESPLWEIPNVQITQHSSGFSPSNDIREFDIFIKNLKKFKQNKKLINVVDFELGY